jgi:capsular polysaccharide biosynthesis protein
MSQQAMDLRRSIQIVRRHRVLVGIAIVIGLVAGGAYSVLHPPMLTSTALVVLPQSVQNGQNGQNAQAGQDTTQNTTTGFMATQVVIASSNPVLAAALPKVSPSVSLTKLRDNVQVASPTSYIVSISAKGKTAHDAETTANAVADSYIAYVGSADSPVGRVQARILESAENATGSTPQEALIITGLIGGLAGAVVGIIVSLAISRNDRRLRERDEIANSIGVPVLTSMAVSHPSDAASWSRLLESYQPSVVDAWRLRKALQHTGIMAEAGGNGRNGAGTSLTVLSLSSDPGALALGPQLAVFAASLKISTALVIGPQQDEAATATLRTACAMPQSAASKLPNQLRVIVADRDVQRLPDVGLTVVVAVVDSRNPKIPDTVQTSTTLLGVSSGKVTAEQLARAAVVASTDGREITGILVADPDPADRTTGGIPQLAPRPPHHRRPKRLIGLTTEIRR